MLIGVAPASQSAGHFKRLFVTIGRGAICAPHVVSIVENVRLLHRWLSKISPIFTHQATPDMWYCRHCLMLCDSTNMPDVCERLEADTDEACGGHIMLLQRDQCESCNSIFNAFLPNSICPYCDYNPMAYICPFSDCQRLIPWLAVEWGECPECGRNPSSVVAAEWAAN